MAPLTPIRPGKASRAVRKSTTSNSSILRFTPKTYCESVINPMAPTHNVARFANLSARPAKRPRTVMRSSVTPLNIKPSEVLAFIVGALGIAPTHEEEPAAQPMSMNAPPRATMPPTTLRKSTSRFADGAFAAPRFSEALFELAGGVFIPFSLFPIPIPIPIPIPVPVPVGLRAGVSQRCNVDPRGQKLKGVFGKSAADCGDPPSKKCRQHAHYSQHAHCRQPAPISHPAINQTLRHFHTHPSGCTHTPKRVYAHTQAGVRTHPKPGGCTPPQPRRRLYSSAPTARTRTQIQGSKTGRLTMPF